LRLADRVTGILSSLKRVKSVWDLYRNKMKRCKRDIRYSKPRWSECLIMFNTQVLGN